MKIGVLRNEYSLRKTLRHSLTTTVLTLLAFNGVGQIQPFSAQVSTPSPNASSIGKYGDMPVSYYTGSPNISIPLYELPGRELSVPISLSYAGSGIKVEEVASWVGLGWTLNAGGAIVRTAIGLPDEGPDGYLMHGVDMNAVLASPTSQSTYYPMVEAGEIDFEPDMFYYNFNGRSGKLVVEQVGGVIKAYSIPYNDLSFEFSETDGGTWVVRDEVGTTYTFGGAQGRDRTISRSYSNGSRTSYTVLAYTSAWYLKSISSSKGDLITFTYNSYQISYCQRVAESNRILQEGSSNICESPAPSRSYNTHEVTGAKLASIASSQGSVEFITDELNERQDIVGDNALKAVAIRNHNGALLKQYTFGHSYFVSTEQLAAGFCNEGNQNSRKYRLRLDTITESSETGSALPPYQFFYNQDNVPERLSNSVDHWGYYNGAPNTSLIPSFVYPVLATSEYLLHKSANRHVDPTKNKVCSLEKIVYPTGGYSEFEFEPNQANVSKRFLALFDMPHIPKTHYASVESNMTGFLIDKDPFSVDFPILFRNELNNEDMPAGAFFDLIVLNGGTCDLTTRDGCGVEIRIKNVTTGNYDYAASGIISLSRTFTFFLPNGNYELEIKVDDIDNPEAPHFIATLVGPDAAYFGEPSADSYNKIMGGLRIKSIKNFDNTGSQLVTKRFTYLSEVAPLQSSGTTGPNPWYIYQSGFTGKKVAANGDIIVYDCYLMSVSAGSVLPMTTTQGSYVGYADVQIYEGPDDSQGKQIVSFTTFTDYDVDANPHYPHTVPIGFDWRRGLQKGGSTYKREETGYSRLNHSQQQYTFLGGTSDPFNRKNTAIKMACLWRDFNGNCSNLVTQPYYNYTEFFFKNLMVEKNDIVNSPFQFFEKETLYQYDGLIGSKHTQPTKQTIKTSKNEAHTYVTKYSFDYANTASDAIELLQTINATAIPIEQQEWKNGYLLNGQVTEYRLEGTKPVVDRSLKFESPVPVTDFVEEKVNGVFTNVVPDSRYKPVIQVTEVDPATGNITAFIGNDGSTNGYTWGYNNGKVICEFKNATPTQVFYTSFEESAGTLGDSKTGLYYYEGTSYTIPTAQQPTGSNLKMTFWYYDDGWKFQQELAYSPVITAPNATRYDEIRVYPAGAVMSTYTYKPGVGVLTVTDTNNTTTYYRYDTAGRLLRTLDEKKNVLKKFDYHYKNQE